MALSVVQTASITSGTGTTASYAAAFGANTTAGNLLVAFFGSGSATATLGTDAADTWTALEGGVITAGDFVEMWYTPTCVGGKTTYTFTRSTGGTGAFAIMEIAGASSTPFDVSTHTVGTTSTSVTTGATATTAQASEIAVVGLYSIFAAGVSGTYSGAAAGYTIDVQGTPTSATGTNPCIALAHSILVATGTPSASATVSATPTHTAGFIATFKGASAGGGSDPFPVGYLTAQLASAVYRM